MEKMPFRPEMTRPVTMAEPAAHDLGVPNTLAQSAPPITTSNWRRGLPILTARGVTLRDLRPDDAPSLSTMLSGDEVARFLSPPPTTAAGVERFIDWALRERASGNYVCFAVVPDGMSAAVGLFQIRSLEPAFSSAEWGFAIASPFWGTGAFAAGAELVLEFSFDVMGVHRLEARAATGNGRGNGALRKLGAVQEGFLRRSFLRDGQYHDQFLWSILGEDWRVQRLVRKPPVH